MCDIEGHTMVMYLNKVPITVDVDVFTFTFLLYVPQRQKLHTQTCNIISNQLYIHSSQYKQKPMKYDDHSFILFSDKSKVLHKI